MIKAFELKGFWWLPDAPQKKVFGTLSFSQEIGAQLELYGVLKQPNHRGQLPNEDFILGFSVDGKEITLLESFSGRTKFSFPGITSSVYTSNMVFLGQHFSNRKELRFAEVSVRFSYLDLWAKITGFKFPQDMIPVLAEKKEITVHHQLPEEFTFASVGEFTLSLLVQGSYDLPTLFSRPRQVRIKEETSFVLKSEKKESLTDFKELITALEGFLSFSIGEPIFPLKIEAKSEKTKLDIYYQLLSVPKEETPMAFRGFLFSYPEIKDESDTLFQNWLEKKDSLEPVINLYLGVKYSPFIYSEHEFLSLIQALEAYHRRSRISAAEGKYQSDNEYRTGLYQSFKAVIPQNIDPDFKQSLVKGKLWYAHEYSLGRRLKEILRYLSNCIPDSSVLTPSNWSQFVSLVKNSRNYLTHYEQPDGPYYDKGEKLYRLSQKLKILLEMCILKSLGFKDSKVKEIFSKNEKAMFELKIPL